VQWCYDYTKELITVQQQMHRQFTNINKAERATTNFNIQNVLRHMIKLELTAEQCSEQKLY